MAIVCRFEKPQSTVLINALTKVEGWIGGVAQASADIRATLNGIPVALATFPRPDVARVHPDIDSFGFSAIIDIRDIISAGRPGIMTFEIEMEQFKDFREFTVSDEAEESAKAWELKKGAKQQRISGILQCPVCKSDVNVRRVCTGCGVSYRQREGALDMLPPNLAARFKIDETENISAHPYSNEITQLIKDSSVSDPLILDCGSGYRFEITDNIVCLEVVPYPSTDVIAVGQLLPFQDESFDIVISTAVLEHVTDPFQCAAEIVRVLKRGGTMFCTVPFLQPEHGYPKHYYNMTLDGLANLFRGAIEIDEKITPDWGHPLLSLAWFLSDYTTHLPAEQRLRFQSMTVDNLIELRKKTHDPIFTDLSREGRRILAASTAIIGHKK